MFHHKVSSHKIHQFHVQSKVDVTMGYVLFQQENKATSGENVYFQPYSMTYAAEMKETILYERWEWY